MSALLDGGKISRMLGHLYTCSVWPSKALDALTHDLNMPRPRTSDRHPARLPVLETVRKNANTRKIWDGHKLATVIATDEVKLSLLKLSFLVCSGMWFIIQEDGIHSSHRLTEYAEMLCECPSNGYIFEASRRA